MTDVIAEVGVKEKLRRLVEQLPDDVTWEQAEYHVRVCRKIAAGVAAGEAGRKLTQEEARRLFGVAKS